MQQHCLIPADCRERYVDTRRLSMALWQESGIRFAGVSDLVRGYDNAHPRRSDVMMIASIAGAGAFDNGDGHTGLMEAGTLFIAVPGKALQFCTHEAPWRIAWWYCLPRPCWLGSRRRNALQLCKDAETFYHLQDTMISWQQSSAEHQDVVKQAAAGIHSLLTAHVHNGSSNDVEPQKDPSMDALVRRISSALHQSWPVDAWANALNCSPATAQRRVRQQYGLSIRQLLLRLRMDAAKTLLRQSQYPIQLIAERCGYSDSFAFSHAFKQATGKSPTAWRQ